MAAKAESGVAAKAISQRRLAAISAQLKWLKEVWLFGGMYRQRRNIEIIGIVAEISAKMAKMARIMKSIES
jgi:hypothetical protein